METSKKLFLFLGTISVCSILGMENASKVDPEIMQYYAQEIKLNDFEKISGISSVSIFPENTQTTLNLVTIVYQLFPSIIVREHAFVNKRLFKSFVYKDSAALTKTFDDQSDTIKHLCKESYQKSEELRQEKQKTENMSQEITKLKNSSLNSLIWAAGSALIIGSLIGGAIVYCNQRASAPINYNS